MATSFDAINSIFYNFLEEDSSFFNYYGVSEYESEMLAQQRADACLTEAAMKLSLRIEADIDFCDFDTELREFGEDLTKEEIFLLASLQYEEYLFRDVAKLRANATRFTSAEQSVFSPANERRTFVEMYQLVVRENEELVDRYVAKDRITGIAKTLEYEAEE